MKKFEAQKECIVGLRDLAEPGCCVCTLGVECWFCAWDWGVGGVGVG